MDFENIDTDELVDLLTDYETEHDVKNAEKIYKIINDRDIESDFWRESFNDEREWIVRTILNCRNPLTIHDIMLIRSDELFREALENYDIGMDDVTAVMECMDEDDQCYTKKRINLICKHLENEDLQKCIIYFENKISPNEILIKILKTELKKRK